MFSFKRLHWTSIFSPAYRRPTYRRQVGLTALAIIKKYSRKGAEPQSLYDFSLRLPSAGRSFLLCENKIGLAQSRGSLSTVGRPQRFYKLKVFARIKKGISATP